jgi:hypothetical protein
VSNGGSSVICALPTLAVGLSEPLQVVVLAPGLAGTITNNATVASITVDEQTGNNSASASTQVQNPKPTLSQLTPSSRVAGGASFTLTVLGGGFVSGAQVLWNGQPRTTNFIGQGDVRATILVGDIASPGTANVTVRNPAPSAGDSDPLVFQIENPLPVLASVSPAYAKKDGPGFTLTLRGSNFVNGAQVVWNGSAVTSNLVSSKELNITVPAADLLTRGSIPVKVNNPAPGGGDSATLRFAVVEPMGFLPFIKK